MKMCQDFYWKSIKSIFYNQKLEKFVNEIIINIKDLFLRE